MPEPRIELGAALQQHDVLPVGYVATLKGGDVALASATCQVSTASGELKQGTGPDLVIARHAQLDGPGICHMPGEDSLWQAETRNGP